MNTLGNTAPSGPVKVMSNTRGTSRAPRSPGDQGDKGFRLTSNKNRVSSTGGTVTMLGPESDEPAVSTVNVL